MASQLTASSLLAQFGFTTKMANDWIAANIGSPKTILDVCQQVGITRAMLSEITGYGVDLITTFFNQFNLDATKLDSQISTSKVDVDLFSLVHDYPGVLTYDASNSSFNFILDFDKTYNSKVKYGNYVLSGYSLIDRIINFGSDDSITLKNYKKITDVSIIDSLEFTSFYFLNPSNNTDKLNSTYISSSAKSNSGLGVVVIVGVHTENSNLWENGTKGVNTFNALSVGDITFG